MDAIERIHAAAEARMEAAEVLHQQWMASQKTSTRLARRAFAVLLAATVATLAFIIVVNVF